MYEVGIRNYHGDPDPTGARHWCCRGASTCVSRKEHGLLCLRVGVITTQVLHCLAFVCATFEPDRVLHAHAESNDCWLKVNTNDWQKVYSEYVGVWHWCVSAARCTPGHTKGHYRAPPCPQ